MSWTSYLQPVVVFFFTNWEKAISAIRNGVLYSRTPQASQVSLVYSMSKQSTQGPGYSPYKCWQKTSILFTRTTLAKVQKFGLINQRMQLIPLFVCLLGFRGAPTTKVIMRPLIPLVCVSNLVLRLHHPKNWRLKLALGKVAVDSFNNCWTKWMTIHTFS